MVQVYRLFLDHTFLKALYCKRKHARVELTIKVIYLGKKHSKECPAQSHDDAFVQRVVVWVQHGLNGDTAGKHKNQEHPQPGHKVLLHLETKQEYVDELFRIFYYQFHSSNKTCTHQNTIYQENLVYHPSHLLKNFLKRTHYTIKNTHNYTANVKKKRKKNAVLEKPLDVQKFIINDCNRIHCHIRTQNLQN